MSLKAVRRWLLGIRQQQFPRLSPGSQDKPTGSAATSMTPAQQEFERLGPWMSRFVIDGVALGGEYEFSTDLRLHHLERRLGSLQGKRVLELGALEGGHTLELARAGATVVAIEGRSTNYERCLFIKRYFRLEKVEFALADLRSVDFSRFGRFDVVLNSGVLYHLDAPWDLLERLGKVAPSMLLWTHCSPTHQRLEMVEVCGKRLEGYWYPEEVLDHPLSGRQSRSFWPTRESLEQILHLTGWSALTWLDFDADGQHGPAATLWAQQEPLPPDPVAKIREVWNSPGEHYEIQGFKIYWETLREVAHYQFEMASGDPTLDLLSYTLSLVRERQQGVSGRALVLGCNAGPAPPEVVFAESGLFDEVTCLDVADGLLSAQALATAGRGQGKVSYKCVDLNAALLDGGPYDLIWSQGTIHHIQALEHLFSEVNRTLSDRGLFVIREYVGPRWIQLSERQARIINRLMPYIPERFRTAYDGQIRSKLVRPTPEEVRATDPSESPRSDEIVPLLRRFFRVNRLRETGGSLLFPLLDCVAGSYEQFPEGAEFLRLLIGFERVLIEEGILPTDYIFAVAEKK